MPTLANRTIGSRFMGLFVGATKSGKSVAEGSFPKPLFDYDFDGRIGGMDGANWIIDKDKIDYKYYPPRVGMNETPTYIAVNNDLEMLIVNCKTNQNIYKTIGLSSLTSATLALLMDSVKLTHADGKGKSIGTVAMADPQDYGFEATNTYNILACLRSVPIPNIIVSAHIVDKYGRKDEADKYSEKIVVGEKLSIRDKIGENVGIYFDHCFKFSREFNGRQQKFFVEFSSDIAISSYPNLPPGKIDITNKDFYKTMMEYVHNGPIKTNP